MKVETSNISPWDKEDAFDLKHYLFQMLETTYVMRNTTLKVLFFRAILVDELIREWTWLQKAELQYEQTCSVSFENFVLNAIKSCDFFSGYTSFNSQSLIFNFVNCVNSGNIILHLLLIRF